MNTVECFNGIDALPCETGRAVHLAIGMFDGAHRGHRLVVESAIKAAAEDGGLAGVLTFWPHPSHLFKPDNPVPMILNPEMKRIELSKLRIDFIVEEAFTREFAAIDSSLFVEMLKKRIPALRSIHTGDNWRFGKGRLGDVDYLKEIGKRSGVDAVALQCLYVDGERVSSTRIRNALSSGDVQLANHLLGYNYESVGSAVEGNRLGRKIGVPTLNMPFEGDLVPRLGVYAARVSNENGGSRLKAVANFGIRPTVDSLSKPLLEVHLLEECPFTYGDRLRVEWLSFIREEAKFDGIEALREQIRTDIRKAEAYFEDASNG